VYCTECGVQNGEGRQFCTKCGTALKKRSEALSLESPRFSGARYASKGQLAWGSAGRTTDLEIANGRLKFKRGEIDIHAIRRLSLIVQPFPWVVSGVFLPIGILTFLAGLNAGGDAQLLLKSIGVGGVAGSIASTVGWLISRGNRWLLIEYSGQDGHAQRVQFRMSRQQTESLYSILQSSVKR
jgi:hypothetical protein